MKSNHPYGEIAFQVMWNRLISVVEEQAQTLVRTAFGTATREAGDLSAGVYDTKGGMLAQAVTGTPGHVNSMATVVGYVLDKVPLATMSDGDVFIINDPWQGTGHLNDIVIVTPTFRRGAAVGLFACTLHVVDIGGRGIIGAAQAGLRGRHLHPDHQDRRQGRDERLADRHHARPTCASRSR